MYENTNNNAAVSNAATNPEANGSQIADTAPENVNSSATADASKANSTSPASTEKTFTQDEVNKIVSERLKAERGKLEKKFADDAAEAAKVASMDAEQKAKHETEKREKALAEREENLAKREKLQLAKEKLSAKGLPDVLIPAVSLGDEAEMDESIAALEKAYSSSVSAEVAKKLAIAPPKQGKPDTKDPFIAGLGL